jgi:hypothetical protein
MMARLDYLDEAATPAIAVVVGQLFSAAPVAHIAGKSSPVKSNHYTAVNVSFFSLISTHMGKQKKEDWMSSSVGQKKIGGAIWKREV